MASIYEALRSIIVADTTINAQVAGRVYFEKTPDQPVFPCIVFEQFGSRAEQSRDGFSKLWYAEFNFNTYVSKDSLLAVGEVIRKQMMALLCGKQGTFSSVDIHGILQQDENVSWIDADQVWAVEQSFTVMYLEP